MKMPPALAPKRMFWAGLGIYGFSLVLQTMFFPDLWAALADSWLLQPLRILVQAAFDIGVGLIVGSLIVSALMATQDKPARERDMPPS